MWDAGVSGPEEVADAIRDVCRCHPWLGQSLNMTLSEMKYFCSAANTIPRRWMQFLKVPVGWACAVPEVHHYDEVVRVAVPTEAGEGRRTPGRPVRLRQLSVTEHEWEAVQQACGASMVFDRRVRIGRENLRRGTVLRKIGERPAKLPLPETCDSIVVALEPLDFSHITACQAGVWKILAPRGDINGRSPLFVQFAAPAALFSRNGCCLAVQLVATSLGGGFIGTSQPPRFRTMDAPRSAVFLDSITRDVFIDRVTVDTLARMSRHLTVAELLVTAVLVGLVRADREVFSRMVICIACPGLGFGHAREHAELIEVAETAKVGDLLGTARSILNCSRQGKPSGLQASEDDGVQVALRVEESLLNGPAFVMPMSGKRRTSSCRPLELELYETDGGSWVFRLHCLKHQRSGKYGNFGARQLCEDFRIAIMDLLESLATPV